MCSTELFPYVRVIFYAVITSVVALDRVALKSKVVTAGCVLCHGWHRGSVQLGQATMAFSDRRVQVVGCVEI